MSGHRWISGGLALLLVLTGAGAGSASPERVVVTDGTVEVEASVRVDDVATGNETDVVVDLELSSEAGDVTASNGWVGFRGPDGDTVGAKVAARVDESRLRARMRLYSGADPGTYTVDIISLPVDVALPDGTVRQLAMEHDAVATFVARPESDLRLDVAPEAVARGQKVYVHGSLDVGLLDGRTSAHPEPGAGEPVEVYFNPSGSAPRELRATLTADEGGYFGREFTADSSGRWSVEYAGTNTTAPAREDAWMSIRRVDGPSKSGVATTKVRGETLRARVTVPRSVTVGIRPKTIVADVSYLFPRDTANSSGLTACHHKPRVCDGRTVSTFSQIWDGNTERTLLYLDATSPAGDYAVTLESRGYRVYGSNDAADVDFSGNQTATTFRLKHTTRIGVHASKARAAKDTKVVLSGRLKEARAEYGVAGYHGVRGATVKVSFDPDGPGGPRYRKSVKTGKGGAYSVSVRPQRSGTWIVEFDGSPKKAADADKVRIRTR
ncbi:hypothetical protein [Isoptericola aurantiacus]|uniref:hypothetical protein n=1 Tax=Isoptericola aurantiacus TaxID=3377839 RepID=UPI00383AD469